jgi:Cu2+-exporting ATPase
MNEETVIKGMFKALGMSCAGCALNVEKTLQQQAGVVKARVNYADSTATVDYDASVVTPFQLRQAVREAGYDLDVEPMEEAEDESKSKAYGVYVAAGLSVIIVTLSMTPHLMHLPWVGWLTAALATPTVFICGQSFFVNAWRQGLHFRMNMDTLVALSAGAAYVFSLVGLFCPEFWTSRGLPVNLWFETAAVIVTFILLGRRLEAGAKRRTASAIRNLIGLQPEIATVISADGQPQDVPARELHPGDCVLVRTGEKIAVDGIIADGRAAIDESMLTGEPLAVAKQVGDSVYAGTIVQSGWFRFIAEKTGSKTLLASMIRMVREAQNSRPPLQKIADRIVAYFVPIVLIIAIVAALLWMCLASDNPTVHALSAFVTTLIVACPCALGLATPTAVIAGVGRGADEGILFKDIDSIEKLRTVDVLLIDKTGTLTEGKPKVTDVMAQSSNAADILYTMEKLSVHPLAKSITESLNNSCKMLECITVEEIAGLGTTAVYDGKRYSVGNSRLFSFADEVVQHWKEAREAEGKTVVLFGDDSSVINAYAIADPLKTSSCEAVKLLNATGVEVVMATGDNPRAAARIAAQTGIERYSAELLPEDKLQLVRQWQRSGKTVAMAGDGVNDSAALAAADVSIAMGNGNDIAIQSAGITIVSGDLRKINDAIQLSRDTVRTIRLNLFWAFFYNLLALPVAAGALYPVTGFLLDPMLAGAAMAFSSVCVVANSLRLRKLKRFNVETGRTGIFVLGSGLLLVLFVMNLLYGTVSIPFNAIVDIFSGVDIENEAWRYIVLQSRLPQAVTALLAGASLAAAGLLLQTLFRNPLAGPSILGVSDGANLGVALVMLLLGNTLYTFSGSLALIIAAFVGAGAVLGVIIWFSTKVSSSVMLLIVGIMVGFLASSAISILNFYSTADRVRAFVMWGLGDFSGVSLKRLPYFVVFAMLALALAISLIKPLNAMLLGDSYAINLGLKVRRVRLVVLLCTGLLTAVTTAFCGPVSFIGLAVPHIARLLLGTANHSRLLPATVIFGAAVALLCNFLTSFPGSEGTLPLNAVTPLIGAPVIIYVIISRRNIHLFN